MPSVLRDISTTVDIEKVVNQFYKKLRKNTRLSVFFKDKSEDQWQVHLQLMVSFWENVLFYSGEYAGNPLLVHRKVHIQQPTTAKDFQIWMRLFSQTIDSMYCGVNTERMKDHAQQISLIMLAHLDG